MTARPSPEFTDAKFFPVAQSMSGFAAASLTDAGRSLAPLAQQTSQCGSEIAQLASRRFSAWSDHHKRLLACRQPTDVVSAMQAFWTRAFDDYTTCNKALLSAWTGGVNTMMAMPLQNGLGPKRDMLSLREGTFERSVAETDPRKADGRRDAA